MALLSRQQVTLLGSAFWNSDNLTGSQTSKEDSYTDETGITNDAKSLYENAFTDSNPGIFLFVILNTKMPSAIAATIMSIPVIIMLIYTIKNKPKA